MDANGIVIDTNVIVSALRSRRGASFRLLSQVGLGRFEICLSVPLYFEYEDVLSRESIGISRDAARDVLNYLCQVARPQEIFYLWRPVLRDPKDDLVLELAVAAQCPRIVTYNTADFVGCERFGVAAITPSAFLNELGEKP